MIEMSTGHPYNFFTKIKKAINDLTTQVLHESKAKEDSKIALQNAILEHGNILSANQNMVTSLSEANDSLNNEIENLRSRLKTANDTLNRLNILRTLNNSSEFPSMEATIRRNLFLERINELDRGGWVNLLRDLHNINLHNEK
jgi:exonuclease VII large subunit